MYLLIYDYTDELGNEHLNIHEDFEGSYGELQMYIRDLRDDGCYNIEATAIKEDYDYAL